MELVLGDITKMKTDAIVNAASSSLRPCAGICQSVFAAADTKKLLSICKKIGHCDIGRAVITPSCGLPCKYIIHVAGAGWYSGQKEERLLFADYYRNALQKAYACHCRTIAVPLMFSGDFHIPRGEALQIVGEVIRQFEITCPKAKIILVLYKQSIYDLAVNILENGEKENEKNEASYMR